MNMLNKLLGGIVLSCAMSLPATAAAVNVQSSVQNIEAAVTPNLVVGEVMQRAGLELGRFLPSVSAGMSSMVDASPFRSEGIESESGGGMMFLAALGVMAMIMRRQGGSR